MPSKYGLLTERTIQAHCTFLSSPNLTHLRKCGSAVAHCPLSNAYFSSQPFRLREALYTNVKVGLGTDIAGTVVQLGSGVTNVAVGDKV